MREESWQLQVGYAYDDNYMVPSKRFLTGLVSNMIYCPDRDLAKMKCAVRSSSTVYIFTGERSEQLEHLVSSDLLCERARERYINI